MRERTGGRAQSPMTMNHHQVDQAGSNSSRASASTKPPISGLFFIDLMDLPDD
jgi:hypothetical protein